MAERLRSKVHSKYSSFFTGLEEIPDLKKTIDLQTYEQMSNDSVINSILDAISISIEEATYNFQEPLRDAGEEEKRMLEFVQDVFEELDFKQYLKAATDYLVYGYQVTEFVMENKRIDGKIYMVPTLLSPVPTKTIIEMEGARNNRGELMYLTQEIDGETRRLPRRTLIIVTANSKSAQDWRGRSPLLPVFKDWWVKNKFWLIQGQTIERFGPGISVLNMPEEEVDSTADQSEGAGQTRQGRGEEEKRIEAARVEMTALAKNNSNSLILPGGYDFQIAERQGNFPDTLNSIKRIEENIYRNFQATHMILGGNASSASNALAVTVSSEFLHQVKGRAKVIVDAVNRDLIRKIIDLNFGKQKRKSYPVLTVNNISKTSSKDLFMFQQYNDVLSKIPEVVQYIVGEVGIPIGIEKIEKYLKEQQNQVNPTRTLIETENRNANRERDNQQQSTNQD